MAFLLYQGCYPLPDRVPKMKDGKEYGDTEGLFRHRWWNYYERGLSFADGEFWQDAEPDLREAIRQRNTDKRRARTYGLHFIDYFPHRELGIVLFEQGRIEEAEKELEKSYSDVKSAKAALYLDRVRKAIIEKKQLAHRAPEITAEPLKQDPDKPFLITIRGVAKSDAFVRHITVNQQEVRIDVSKQIVDFQSEVPLVPGENNIRITAANLMGDSDETFIKINVDNTGPVISVDDLNDYQIPENSIYVADDSGIAEISVNKQKIPFKYGITEFRFPEKSLSFPATDELVIEAKDITGNITTAKLSLSKKLSKLLADNSALPIEILRASNRNEAPFIDLKHLKHPLEEEHLTYRDYAFIEVKISDKKEMIKELFINDKPLSDEYSKLEDSMRTFPVPFDKHLKFQNFVRKVPFKNNYVFSRKISLNKGKNEIVVGGPTISGEYISKSVEITRRSLLDRKEDRLKIAIAKFDRVNENMNQYPTDKFEDILISIMNETGRFQIVNVGNRKDFLMKGSITKRKKSIEIFADLVSENDSIHLEEKKEHIDVYNEDINPILKELAGNIHKKLSDKFPMKEGRVEEKKDGKIAINIGEPTIKQDMNIVIVIYDIRIIKSDTELLDLTDRLGYATITMVNKGASWASLNKGSNSEAIKVYQPIVTR